ncbi:hypothetical protein CAOG_05645 [Capsaspora owczarzaki ATCC 30864]|uniref:hypothetical protein n=1 Tax=Capsaspora owczarzaki (strain ATCC 30864) TaxID=595528 RepID=UPI0001FE33B6|nr:hypothetical protein CAOG_05645 [Capsaspora owczarzaki ATCC 30864]|eukprot:XP_004346318.1 hypothetical protein CAOG_05645 [Capsaspora owczarzaki ATCC 30864]
MSVVTAGHDDFRNAHRLAAEVRYLSKAGKSQADKIAEKASKALQKAMEAGRVDQLIALNQLNKLADIARRQDIEVDDSGDNVLFSTTIGVSCWRLHPTHLKTSTECKLLSGCPPFDQNIFRIYCDKPVRDDENQHMLLGPARDMPRALFETALSRLIEQSPCCVEIHAAPAGDPATLVEPLANLKLGASSLSASATTGSFSSAAPSNVPAPSHPVAANSDSDQSENPLDAIDCDELDDESCLLLKALKWTIFLPHVSAAEKAVAYYIATRIVGENTVEMLSERSTLWWFARDALTRYSTTDDREINAQDDLIAHLDRLIRVGKASFCTVDEICSHSPDGQTCRFVASRQDTSAPAPTRL